MKLKKKDVYEPEGLAGHLIDFAAFFASVAICTIPAGIIIAIADIVTSGILVSINSASGDYGVGFITALLALPLNNWINGKIHKMQQKEKGND